MHSFVPKKDVKTDSVKLFGHITALCFIVIILFEQINYVEL